MNKKEYLKKILTLEIDEKKVSLIEQQYSTSFPKIVKLIITNSDETVIFEDDSRALSFSEMVDAEKDLHVDFKLKGIIPLFDCGDNDFIVFHYNNKKWSKFNIIDEISFKEKNTLEELLK